MISTLSRKNIPVTKILILTANPQNTDKLHLNEEVREIQEGLQRSRSRDRFEIISKWAVRPQDLRRALLDHEPQIVHFSGHGAGSDGLVLESDDGQMQMVSTIALARLFRLVKNTVKCVVLNACYSEVQAVAIQQHIDYVIGMGQSISDRAAIEFAVGFYDALGANRGYAEAFEFGLTAIELEGISESSTPKIRQRSQLIPLEALNERGGTMDLLSPFYVERLADSIAFQTIEKIGGVTITIKGSRQIGKSSLLMRTLARAKEVGKQVVYLDFQILEQSILQDTDRFYRHFCNWLTEELNLEQQLNDCRQPPLSNNLYCSRYVERQLLPSLTSPLVLAIDKVERVFGATFQSDFFAMLRGWHNKRASNSSIWRQLDLVLVTSMEPYQLIDNLNLSPFNVGEIIDLADFTDNQVAELNQRHNSPLNQQELEQLMQLLSGHPYLTRYSLRLLASNAITAPKLFDRSTKYGGYFESHFRMFRLDEQRALRQGVLEVMRDQRCTNQEVFFQLLSAGLIRRQDKLLAPRCQLYADYFQELLHD